MSKNLTVLMSTLALYNADISLHFGPQNDQHMFCVRGLDVSLSHHAAGGEKGYYQGSAGKNLIIATCLCIVCCNLVQQCCAIS
jgi:hypothetical protein